MVEGVEKVLSCSNPPLLNFFNFFNLLKLFNFLNILPS